MVGYVAVDVVVGNGAMDLYWGQNGRIWYRRSQMETMLKRMTLYICTGDGVVGYCAVCLCMSLLETVRQTTAL